MRARPKREDCHCNECYYSEFEQWAVDAEQKIKELKELPFDWEFAARQFDADVLNKAMEIVKEEPSVTPVKAKRWLEIKALWDISDYLQTNYLKK